MSKPANSNPLKINGIVMPAEFPVADYEIVQAQLARYATSNKEMYLHFAGAWNAVSYRYKSLVECGESFTASVIAHGAAPDAEKRYAQERDIFGFFSNGFSVFESYFYAMFAVAGIIDSARFPLITAKDQRAVTPKYTAESYAKAFPGDTILNVFTTLLNDSAYLEWQEIRNVLTHRSAPGRTFFVTFGNSETPPNEWKIKDIPLDEKTAPKRRSHASRILSEAIKGSKNFVFKRLV